MQTIYLTISMVIIVLVYKTIQLFVCIGFIYFTNLSWNDKSKDIFINIPIYKLTFFLTSPFIKTLSLINLFKKLKKVGQLSHPTLPGWEEHIKDCEREGGNLPKFKQRKKQRKKQKKTFLIKKTKKKHNNFN